MKVACCVLRGLLLSNGEWLLDYFTVAKICNQMKLTGEKPSVRKIRERTGGSFTTIAEFLKEWRAESVLADSTEMTISEELQKAILAEFAEVAMAVQSSLQESIDEKDVDFKEAKEALAEHEALCRKQGLKINELETEIQNSRLDFEKKLGACESTVSFLKDREEYLQKKAAELHEKYHQAEMQTAIANTKTETTKTESGNLKGN